MNPALSLTKMKTFLSFITEDDAPPTWSGQMSQVPMGAISSSVTRKPRKWARHPIPIGEPIHTPMGPDPGSRDPLP